MNRGRLTCGVLRKHIVCYLLLAPTLLMFVIFVLVPAVQTVYISLTQWEGIGPKTWVGLSNYKTMLLSNAVYLTALRNTVVWTLVTMTVPVAVGLFQANLLVRGSLPHRLAKLYQLIYFLPQVISTVVAAIAWKFIYDPVMGPLNDVLRVVGMNQYANIGWLGNPKTVMTALCVVNVWIHSGFCCVVFAAAMQGIDKELYDAAMVDGATRSDQFWRITLPGIRESMTTVLVLTMMWSFKVFDIIWTMTKGGPGQHSYVFAIYAYVQGFSYNRLGLSAAITVSLTLIAMVFSKAFTTIRERGRY